ncbi:MAG TPA: AraC family transcriptional regulator [Chitinophagaceae bacterium]
MKAKFLKIVNAPEASFDARWTSSKYFNTPWHFHPELELNYILSSTGTRFVGDHIDRFGPGDLVLIGSNLPHLWKNDSHYPGNNQVKAEAVNIRFSVEQLHFLLGEMPELAKVSKLLERAKRGIIIHGKVKKKVSELMMVILEQKGFKRLITLLTILDLLAETKDYKLLSHERSVISGRRNDEKRMNVIYDYVLKNYPNEISLKETSKLVYMNPSSFSRYFKHCAGKSFSDFIIEIRIGNACKMLVETDLSVSAIFYECGFNNQSNFNTLFKRRMGVKPLEYRKNYAE